MPFAHLVIAILSAQAESGPSFDCARASTPVEHAICADPEWSRLDLRMAEQYRAVSRTLSGPAREALRRDQRWFLAAQEEWFENRHHWEGFGDVPQRLASRTEFLAAIRRGSPTTLVGRWRNTAGEVEITRSAPGRLSVAIGAANPVNARWLCEGAGIEGPLEGRVVEGLASGDPGYRIRVTLRDGYLEVEEEPLTSNSYGPPYCGANGHVSGVYLPVE